MARTGNKLKLFLMVVWMSEAPAKDQLIDLSVRKIDSLK